MLLRTFLALFVVAGAWAQQTRPAKPPQKRDEPLTRSSFSAKGLDHEDDLTDFFVGNFADVPFDRGTMGFSVLFQQYLEAYARHCGASLPVNNRVEMTRQVCADPPPLPTPLFGPAPDPSTTALEQHGCSTWRTVSLGYADQCLYYLAEAEFKYNHRIALGVDDTERAAALLRGTKDKRLLYRQPDVQA